MLFSKGIKAALGGRNRPALSLHFENDTLVVDGTHVSGRVCVTANGFTLPSESYAGGGGEEDEVNLLEGRGCPFDA